MHTKLATLVIALTVALALPASARAEQKAKPAACATTGSFAEPDACQCPAGFGKILLGTGGGECRRLVCQKGKEIDPKLCDCPEGSEAKASKTKGKATCVQSKSKATASAK
jgi:hypothetical protein